MIYRFLIFLVLNFAALGVGSLFTSVGVASEWYANLLKAPWTPPGWVFGVAWSTIMVCFAVFMSLIWTKIDQKKLLYLYALQWVLNSSWNPTFFYFHATLLALMLITGLTILIGYFYINYRTTSKLTVGWVLPYFIWLLLATSLNGFILIFN